MDLKDEKTPLDVLMESFSSEKMQLTPEEKDTAKSLSTNTSSFTKASLIGLLSSKLNKAAVYDEQAQSVLKMILDKAAGMEPNELIALFSVLTRTSTSEAKVVLDAMKKPDPNMQKLVIELQGGAESVVKVKEKKEDDSVIKIRPEMADRMLRLVSKFSEEDRIRDVKGEVIDAESE